jgi:hypothetical protein
MNKEDDALPQCLPFHFFRWYYHSKNNKRITITVQIKTVLSYFLIQFCKDSEDFVAKTNVDAKIS